MLLTFTSCNFSTFPLSCSLSLPLDTVSPSPKVAKTSPTSWQNSEALKTGDPPCNHMHHPQRCHPPHACRSYSRHCRQHKQEQELCRFHHRRLPDSGTPRLHALAQATPRFTNRTRLPWGIIMDRSQPALFNITTAVVSMLFHLFRLMALRIYPNTVLSTGLLFRHHPRHRRSHRTARIR